MFNLFMEPDVRHSRFNMRLNNAVPIRLANYNVFSFP